ncbi:MAG: hypothetical protein AB7V42_06365 [Thermoleophilia bacterium]
MQCMVTGGWAVYEAGMLFGAPVAYAGYRRARIRLGLGDPAVAPCDDAPGRAPAPAPASQPVASRAMAATAPAR